MLWATNSVELVWGMQSSTFMIQVPPVRLNSSTNILYSRGTTYVTGKKL